MCRFWRSSTSRSSADVGAARDSPWRGGSGGKVLRALRGDKRQRCMLRLSDGVLLQEEECSTPRRSGAAEA